MRKLFHEGHVAFTVVIRTVCQFLIHPVEPFLHLADMGKSLFRLFTHRMLVAQHHHLRQIADGGTAGNSHRSRSGLLQSGYNLQHGGLPGPVLAHKGDTVFVIDDIRNVLKQRGRPELHS